MEQASSDDDAAHSPGDNPTSQIIRFFDPATKAPFDSDEPNTTLDDVVAWGDYEWEYRHDFIQHLFPLPERSGANPDAPSLTETDWRTFHERPDLQAAFGRGFVRMCKFYGYRVDSMPRDHVSEDLASSIQATDGQAGIGKASDFEARSRRWLQYSCHHHLRFTRIIRSLRIFGFIGQAAVFYNAIIHANEEADNEVSHTSIQYWHRAREQPLGWPVDARGQMVQWLEKSDPAKDGTSRRFWQQ